MSSLTGLGLYHPLHSGLGVLMPPAKRNLLTATVSCSCLCPVRVSIYLCISYLIFPCNSINLMRHKTTNCKLHYYFCVCVFVYFNVGLIFLSSLSLILLYYYCLWAMLPDLKWMNEWMNKRFRDKGLIYKALYKFICLLNFTLLLRSLMGLPLGMPVTNYPSIFVTRRSQGMPTPKTVFPKKSTSTLSDVDKLTIKNRRRITRS